MLVWSVDHRSPLDLFKSGSSLLPLIMITTTYPSIVDNIHFKLICSREYELLPRDGELESWRAADNSTQCWNKCYSNADFSGNGNKLENNRYFQRFSNRLNVSQSVSQSVSHTGYGSYRCVGHHFHGIIDCFDTCKRSNYWHINHCLCS